MPIRKSARLGEIVNRFTTDGSPMFPKYGTELPIEPRDDKWFFLNGPELLFTQFRDRWNVQSHFPEHTSFAFNMELDYAVIDYGHMEIHAHFVKSKESLP